MNRALNRSRSLQLVPFNAITLGDGPAWLIKGLIPLYGLTVLYGPPKSFKSFWTFDVLMHVVLGWSYRGLRVTQGAVVYVVAEGEHGFKARKEAFCKSKLKGCDNELPFYIVPIPIDLIQEREKLIEEIRKVLGDQLPVTVVFDTLARTMSGPENSNDAMGEYIEAVDAVRVALNCGAIVVHHSGHEGTRPRGGSSLTGAADAQLAVKKHSNGIISVVVDAMRDGPDGATYYSRFEKVVVGTDRDGDEITSCIIVDAVPTEVEEGERRPKLMPQAAKAFNVLKELIAEEGEPPPKESDLPRGVNGVGRKRWREACKSNALAGGSGDEAFKKAWMRARGALEEKNLVRILDCGFTYVICEEEAAPD
tara:strand:+ start:2769 stop:3863 length:1095 start_codon:yes stop_codon:yes gene_type:complete